MKEVKQQFLGCYTVFKSTVKTTPVVIGVRIKANKVKEMPMYNFKGFDYTYPSLQELETFAKELNQFVEFLKEQANETKN